MILDQIKELLKDRIGLHAATVGDSAIRNAVQRRAAACGCASDKDYLEFLRCSDKEVTELIEAVVIPETWFFRNENSFHTLREHIRQRHQKGELRQPLRALSLPCSTGEEPYSIAITLIEAGLDASRFRVDAVDVSRQALQRAKQGQYGPHSFRGHQNQRIKRRYFVQDGTTYSVVEQVRDAVSFRHGNILKPTTLSHDQGYDIIFCRNLLIYFDEDTKVRAYQNLHRLLKDDALLVLGHAECGTAPSDLFVSLGHANSFAFAKRLPGSGASRPKVRSPAQKNIVPPRPRPAPKRQPARPPTPTATPEPPRPSLEQARQLADQGQFDEAHALCQEHMASGKPDAQAFHLLGLIEEARGHIDHAESHLRKALYLEPRHYESLVHLALLLERRGDTAGAQLLRQRAERTQLSTAS